MKVFTPIQSIWAHFKEVWKYSCRRVWLRCEVVLWRCNFTRQMIASLRVLGNWKLSYWRSKARWESSSTFDMTMILHLGLREQDAVCQSVYVHFFFFFGVTKASFSFSSCLSQSKKPTALHLFFSPPQQHFAGKKDQKDFRNTMKDIFWNLRFVPWRNEICL